MSREKLRILRTDLTNLISNLRGEIGEIVTSWTLLRQLKANAAALRTSDILADAQNRQLVTLEILGAKLEDEIVGRLSELAEAKIGQLTFFFAAVKLDAFHEEVKHFQRFIAATGIEEKRHLDVSHKAIPETFAEHRHRHIPYRTLVEGIARANRLMKLIDRRVLGPSSPYLWREMRRKRYQPMTPPSAGYLLMPHMRLSELDRAGIIQAEDAEGLLEWVEMDTVIDGVPGRVLATKEWGGVILGSTLLLLNNYPLQSIASLNTGERLPHDT